MDNKSFEEILAKKSLMLEFVEDYQKKQLKLALFGAGNSLRNAIGFLNAFNIKADLLIDNDETKVNKELLNLRIISYEDFKKVCEEYIVLILPQDIEVINQIKAQLEENVSKENIYTFDFIYYDFYNHMQKYDSFKTFMIKFRDEINWLYNNLIDEKSKSTLIGFLKGRVTQDYNYYNEIHVAKQYFAEDIIKLSKNETFVDCGAWDGDTVKEFIELVGENNYNKIHCFEPDEITYPKLEKFVKEIDFNRKITLYKNAVWEKNMKLKFNGIGETQSSVSGNDDLLACIEVEAIKLDSLNLEDVTYIKMDIEGAEHEALIGASQIIEKLKPKLGICVYHKYEDLITVPQLIKKINPDYKIYLRHHKPYGSELVLYAVDTNMI